jgi:AcrR family transcriptional regulator
LVRLSIKTFCKYGLDKTTTKKLAEEANLSEAGLYIYFKNKDDLLRKCVEEHFRKVKADIDTLLLKFGSSLDAFVKETFYYTKEMLLENRFIFQVLSHPHYSEIIKNLRKYLLDSMKKQTEIMQKLNVPQETGFAAVLLFNSALNNFILTQDEDGFMIQMKFLLKIFKE